MYTKAAAEAKLRTYCEEHPNTPDEKILFASGTAIVLGDLRALLGYETKFDARTKAQRAAEKASVKA